MTKASQNLLLIAISAAVFWITATGEYVNYVRPGFRPFLIAAATALLALGASGLRREWRATPSETGGHGSHDHSSHDHGGRGPRVAWLMCLPVVAVFVVAPPALGSFTASRDTGRQAQPPPAPASGYGELPRTGRPVPMTMGEFIGRSFEAQTGQATTLQGVPVQLTGFVTPRENGGGWQVTRLKMACCAGDAVPFPVVVHGLKRPPADAWVRVVGVWRPPAGGKVVSGLHELQGHSVELIEKPRNPYE
ncbi:TIGR03943 family putative permease subunit [Actinomadura sp. SCN-SB]|uniref:TIGR03943 family putative permease subunit n=1 Tax=Actinomadura sp. SCN-SB TaxID=3373092 RepID=UPI0037509819